MAQWVKWLLQRNKEPSSDPKQPRKQSGRVVHISNHVSGWAGTGGEKRDLGGLLLKQGIPGSVGVSALSAKINRQIKIDSGRKKTPGVVLWPTRMCIYMYAHSDTYHRKAHTCIHTCTGKHNVKSASLCHLWSSIFFSAPFVFLTMVLFVGNTDSNHLSEELSHKLYTEITIKTTTHSYGYSFWLILLVILLNIATVVIIIFYQKARYQQKQEQRKPVEYAPRDGILFWVLCHIMLALSLPVVTGWLLWTICMAVWCDTSVTTTPCLS